MLTLIIEAKAQKENENYQTCNRSVAQFEHKN